MKRVVQPEILDELPPDDPCAMRSRRDLRRVNAWMGNHSIMAGTLKDISIGVPRQITELGCGDGDFLLQVARMTNWQNVDATLLDLQQNVSAETLAGFSKLGWRAKAVVADVLDWPQSTVEAVVANLFLHHFEDGELKELLRIIAARAKLFIAVEPERLHFSFACAQMLRLIGCGKVTRHDAEKSIAAGFVHTEISALWPDTQSWQLTEHAVGLFSHLFIAQKIS
jgi:hypothetical protein